MALERFGFWEDNETRIKRLLWRIGIVAFLLFGGIIVAYLLHILFK